jgi:nicotinamidase-related amidase
VAVGNEFTRSDVPRSPIRRRTALAGSAGATWDDRVPIGEAFYLLKRRGDAFSNPALERLLASRQVGEIAVAGLFGHACVSATVIGALRQGFRVRVLASAIADRSNGVRDRALRRLAQRHAMIVAVGAPAFPSATFPLSAVPDRVTTPATA